MLDLSGHRRRGRATMIEVRDVTKRYGGLVAVNHASFTVMPGEVLGYLGPNGSGKSTTVKMLVGLMPPSHGSVLYDGVDIQEDLIAYKSQVGYVPGGGARLHVPHRPRIPAAGRPAARHPGRAPRIEDQSLPGAVRARHGLPRAAHVVLEGHAAEDPALGRAAPQPAGRRARRAGVRPRRLDRARPAHGREDARRRAAHHLLQLARARDDREDQHARDHPALRPRSSPTTRPRGCAS